MEINSNYSTILFYSRSVSNPEGGKQKQKQSFFPSRRRTCAYSWYRHAAIAQTILLAVGYLYRSNHESVKKISGSSAFLRMVSNRLSASVPRARYLGMIIAVAVSRLVDEPGRIMNFGVEEMDSEDARHWMDLVHVLDKIGSLDDLPKSAIEPAKRRAVKKVQPPTRSKKTLPIQSPPASSKMRVIEELSDSGDNTESEEEDLDLKPYAAPDSDPSDSDDDPTLLNRNKPTAPVYISTLIKQLNANDDLPTVELALRTAPSLIRRKANFGDELSSNIIQLAACLINLQEGMSQPEMQQLRVEALIACQVSQPAIMGPWMRACTLKETSRSHNARPC